MKNSKMSLEAFKAKAENQNVVIATDNIQGGMGTSGQVHPNIDEKMDLYWKLWDMGWRP